MRSSACSRLRKAIRALDGGEVHKGGSLGSQVRERRILVTRERSDGRSGAAARPRGGTGRLSSARGTAFPKPPAASPTSPFPPRPPPFGFPLPVSCFPPTTSHGP